MALLPDAPLPPPAPRGAGFPVSTVLWSALTTATLPARSASPRYAVPSSPPVALPLVRSGVHPTRRSGVVCGIPHPLVLLEGRSSASQVPREPSCAPALLSDPAEACSQAVHEQGTADRIPTRAAPGLSISRLDDTALTLPVYASQRRVAPSPRKTRFWRSPTLPGGAGYPLGSDSRFPVVALPPFSTA
jgi:hypothetical protein